MKKFLLIFSFLISSFNLFALDYEIPLGEYILTTVEGSYTRNFYTLGRTLYNSDTKKLTYYYYATDIYYQTMLARVQSMTVTELNSYSLDTDNDGILDIAEIYYFGTATSDYSIENVDKTLDLDDDGYSDYLEYTKGTNPFSASDYPANTDKDIGSLTGDVDIGVGSSSEADKLWNSNDKLASSADGTKVNDLLATLLGDSDISSMTDDEINTYLTESDYDGDGLTDYEEILIGTNPLTKDVLSDDYATYDDDGKLISFTDSDGDGCSDYIEEQLGTSPNSSSEVPTGGDVLDEDFEYKDKTADTTLDFTFSFGNGSNNFSVPVSIPVKDTLTGLEVPSDDDLENMTLTEIISSYFKLFYAYFQAIVTYLDETLSPFLTALNNNLVNGFSSMLDLLSSIKSYLSSLLSSFSKESSSYALDLDSYEEYVSSAYDTFVDKMGISDFVSFVEDFEISSDSGIFEINFPILSMNDGGINFSDSSLKFDCNFLVNWVGCELLRNVLLYVLILSFFMGFLKLFLMFLF